MSCSRSRSVTLWEHPQGTRTGCVCSGALGLAVAGCCCRRRCCRLSELQGLQQEVRIRAAVERVCPRAGRLVFSTTTITPSPAKMDPWMDHNRSRALLCKTGWSSSPLCRRPARLRLRHCRRPARLAQKVRRQTASFLERHSRALATTTGFFIPLLHRRRDCLVYRRESSGSSSWGSRTRW